MVTSLAERFRRAVLSNDLASAKTIAQRALAETCNDPRPFDIRNQTILRSAGLSSSSSHHLHHHLAASSSSSSSSTSFTSNSTAPTSEASTLAISQDILPALSETQHHLAKQSRIREKNRQAGRCKSSLALAIESDASIEMIQWLLDMGHERGHYTRDYRNCTMLSLAAQYNRTDVIEALCVDAVSNAAFLHHQDAILFENGFQRRQQERHHREEDDEDEEAIQDERNGITTNVALQSDDLAHLHKKTDFQPDSYRGSDGIHNIAIDKFLSSTPILPSHHQSRFSKSNDSARNVENLKSSSDEVDEDSISKEVTHLLDSPDELGRTALALSCMKGYQDVVTHLLNLGADINLADYEGNTPLHYASSYNHLLIVQLLIERGCFFATKNKVGFTAADYAYTSNLKGALEAFARGKFERDGKGIHSDEVRAIQNNNKIKQTLLESAKSMQSSVQFRLGH